MTAQSPAPSPAGSLSPSPGDPFAEALGRLEEWRRSKRPGRRMPEDLWRMAEELAAEHGVSRVAVALRVSYPRLRRRVEAAAGGDGMAVVPHGGFIEVPFMSVPSAAPGRCVLELGDGRGVQLRVELSSATSADVAAVVRGLWEASR